MIDFSKQHSSKIRKIALHVGVWSIAIISTLLESDKYNIGLNLDKINFPMWIAYIYVFYISYLFLIPKLLFKKKTLLYFILSLFLVGSAFVCVRTWYQIRRIHEYRSFIAQREHDEIIPKRELDINNVMPRPNLRDSGKPQTPEAIRARMEREYSPRNMFSLDRYDPFSIRNIGLLYGILFIMSISVIARLTERSKVEAEKAKELEKEKISSELEYLKQQINPHFLFNALNSIYSLTILNSETAPDAVLKLSSILRYMLYETDKDMVQLDDEIEVMENYLGLQRLRLTKKTTVNFTKEGNFEPYRIEPMLLIPILENAFKYGVDSSKATDIDILLRIDKGSLTFKCVNSIIHQNNDNKNSGIGIKNIRRRLDLIYDDNYTFKISTQKDLFTVILTLPLQKIR